MRSRIINQTLVIALLISVLTINISLMAKEISGVQFDEEIKLGEESLVLKGLGLRTFLFFKVYAAGLYVPANIKPEAILSTDTPKKIELVLRRDMSHEKMVSAIREGFEKNASEEQMAQVEKDIQRFSNLFMKDDFIEKNHVSFSYLPSKGVEMSVNKKSRGTIESKLFCDILFRVWLGDRPADDDLKEGLLGKDV